MNNFPPPSPDDRRDSGAAIDTSTTPRRRGVVIAALTAGVLIGGVVAGTQFVSASTTTPRDEVPTEDASVDESLPADDESPETPVEPSEAPDGSDVIDDDVEPQFPGELRGHIEAFEAFEACLGEQIGDITSLDGGIGDVWFGKGVGHGSVSVDVPTADGDVAFSSYDFGDGDGTITITKAGDDVSVAVEGDVTTFEHDDFEAQMAEMEAAWEAVEVACGDLLPDGLVDIADGVFEKGSLDLGGMIEMAPFDLDDLEGFDPGELEKLDVGELDVGELLGELDLGELDVGELLAELQAQLTD